MLSQVKYRKVRGFGSVFTAAFAFIRQNFRAVYGSLFLVAGPFLVISSAISAFWANTSIASLFRIMRHGKQSAYQGSLQWVYLLTLLVSIIGYSVFLATLQKSVTENEGLEENKKLKASIVTKNLFRDYWPLLGNMLLFALAALLIGLFAGFVIFGLSYAIVSLLQNSIAIGVFILILFLALLFIVVPLLTHLLIASFFVCQRDRVNIFIAIGRVASPIREEFWNTWLFSLVALIIYSVLLGLCYLPNYILFAVTIVYKAKDTDVTSTPLLFLSFVLIMITTLMSAFAQSIHFLLQIFHYGNIEERKRGFSILEKINKI